MLTHARQLVLRTALSALAGLLLLAGTGAQSASAAYGGLGRIGSSTIKPGTTGAHGQISPYTDHNFAVDPSTGEFFIVDEFSNEGKNEARLQKFSAKGEFLAENRVKIPGSNGGGLGGLAVDPVRERVYLLLTQVRPAENEATRTKIENKENSIFTKEEQRLKAEEKHEEAKVKELTEQIAKLEEEIAQLEEEILVFDEEANAAGEVWSFSTVVKEGKLKEPKVLVKSEALQPASEEEKVPLLHTTGIAVDPVTHDIVIAGQEDESPRRGPGEEELRAAVERIHENGELGPRYVDRANCLDQGEPVVGEPACEERPTAEFPRSPIVTPQGKVYLELSGASGEIWEMPVAVESDKGPKEVVSLPKRIFTMTEQQKLLRFTGEEETANTMSFASTGAGEGTIYVDASVEGEAGILALDWVQSGEAATVSERGWTAGQSKTSKQEKCAIPPISRTALLGASGEQVMLFGAKPEITGEAAIAAVFGFGPSGEACGHPEATPPKVEFGEQKEATEVPAGQTTKLTSKVIGANAQSAKWKLKYEGGEETAENGYQFDGVSLSHAFLHVGKYEITEVVQTDNLGTPSLTVKATQQLTVTAAAPKVKIAPPGSVHAGDTLGLEATVTDANEAEPHLKYIWDFGDGSAKVEGEQSGKPSPVTLKVEHAFKTRCPVSCTVTLEVEDEAAKGKRGKTSVEVVVLESKAEEEAKHKAEEEAAAKAKAEAEAAAKARAEAEAAARKAEEEQAAKAKAEAEAAARKKQEEEAAKAHSPEAKVAGSALPTTPNGTVTVKVSCPAGETMCTGTVTLKTLSAVSAKRKAILTLGSGSFSVVGGQIKAIKLHLSSKARKLLARSHTLRAVAIVAARDSSGATKTTKRTVVLRLARKH